MLADAKPYHPLGNHVPAKLKRPDNAFHERWEVVLAAMKQYDARSFCDLGCAEGYYVRRAAQELGIFAIGIDREVKRLRWANAVSVLDDDWCCGFVQMELATESLRMLPQFDAVACMSLMHHVIHEKGVNEAKALLRVVGDKTRKCMIFDMGGPEEVGNQWAASLSMFAGDVDGKIMALLAECGFANIRSVGRTIGYDTNVMRSMFIAEPAST